MKISVLDRMQQNVSHVPLVIAVRKATDSRQPALTLASAMSAELGLSI